MRRIPCDVAILLIISAFLLAPSWAGAQVTADYFGETTSRTSYSDNNYDDDLWDYVYKLSKTGNSQEPEIWGIVMPVEPVKIYDEAYPTSTDWAHEWDPEITSDDAYYDYFAGTPLDGQAAVVWTWVGEGWPVTGTFHFQSDYAPVKQPWAVVGTGDPFYTNDSSQDGYGPQWSANPEPASMALSCLALLGVGFWRRRKIG